MDPVGSLSLDRATFSAKVGKVSSQDRGGDLDRTVEGQGNILSRCLRDIPLVPGFPVAFALHNTDYAINRDKNSLPLFNEKGPVTMDQALFS
jgi:hypothetical protein